MNKSELYNSIFNDLKTKLHLLEDKPEETVDSTLKALWLTAGGHPVSAEEALVRTIPDLSDSQIKSLHHLIDLRLNNVPLAHITKRQNFMGIELLCDKRALIPRKETEILGRKALELSLSLARSRGMIRILDVCCGSGNLGVAIAKYNPECMVFSTDISHEAVALTQENINFLNLNDRMISKQGDLLSVFETYEFFSKTDLIICNPPYISSSKVQKMATEIADNEPVLAFDGGMLGIKIIQKLISEAPKFLNTDGWLIFEVGMGQGTFITQMCERSKLYRSVDSVQDNSGNTRVILAKKAYVTKPGLF